ncbi:MAG TPA: hypothetical protein VI461_10685 [Chitinophagaceae bacterium]|nr:hypothetical protein [Chitinophagaceae bacterium]
MEVTKFEIEFKFKERKFHATCQKFQVHNYPQIRVAVKKGKEGEIFIFYEVNWPKQKIFWYELPGTKQLFAKEMANILEVKNQS